MRLALCIILFGLGLIPEAAARSPVLNQATEKWRGEIGRWAFTMRVRKFDGEAVEEERVERYDPSKAGAARWTLLSVDGQAPTDERRLAWQKVKARKRQKAPKLLDDYLDLENATLAGSTPETISYLLPMRSPHAVLLPVDHVVLTVTVNRATHAIEEVKAGIDVPFRAALGLARIIELNFDVRMNPSTANGAVVGPATSRPTGLAHVVMARLGERIEYDWSDFRRVTPAGAPGAGETPEE
ncbi:MAG: hypothetical protein ABI222_03075 [Opitutaceae bacterium]